MEQQLPSVLVHQRLEKNQEWKKESTALHASNVSNLKYPRPMNQETAEIAVLSEYWMTGLRLSLYPFLLPPSERIVLLAVMLQRKFLKNERQLPVVKCQNNAANLSRKCQVTLDSHQRKKRMSSQDQVTQVSPYHTSRSKSKVNALLLDHEEMPSV